jgi:RNA polymerase sigma-70 factor (ECF subfamily)
MRQVIEPGALPASSQDPLASRAGTGVACVLRPMDAAAQEQLEQEIRRRFTLGDLQGAATAALRGYGPQILGLLVALHHDQEEASEVFSMFTEDMWRGLRGFAWSCSFRTWAYTIARNCSLRLKMAARRRTRRQQPLDDCPALSEVEAQVRTETLTYLRTDTKARVSELRKALSDEDQLLLVLRVDKQMAWEDLARVMSGGEIEAGEALKRESARLRKRFQLIKEKLMEMGTREGLIPGKIAPPKR